MYKFKRKTFYLFFILVLFLMTSCGNNSKFDEVISVTNLNHENIPIPKKIDYILSLYPNEYDEEQYKKYPLEYQNENIEMPRYVTKEEAIQEVELLFNQLRLHYGKYYYLGGEEVFGEAENKCINALKEEEDKILVLRIVSILEENLKFVNDAHFSINESTTYQQKYTTFHDIEQKFTYEDDQYINADTGLTVASIKVNGEGTDEGTIFSQVLEDDGSIYYRVVITMYEEPEVEITYEDNSTTKVVFKSYHYSQASKTDYSSRYVDGALVLTPGSFYDENKQAFLDSAEEVKNSDFLVLDLLNNGGGYLDIPVMWLQDVFSEAGSHNFGVYRLTSILDESEYGALEDAPTNFNMSKITDTFFLINPKIGLFPQDKKIIVLTSGKTASAAEWFVDSLHFYENAIFIGTNTRGAMSSNAAFSIITEYSKIPITFGNSLVIFDDSYFQEFVGLKPDIYYFGTKDLSELVVKTFK